MKAKPHLGVLLGSSEQNHLEQENFDRVLSETEDPDQFSQPLSDVSEVARDVLSPDSAERDRTLALEYNKIGDRLLALGRHLDALASYRKSLSIRKHLTDSFPYREDYLRDLSVSFDRIGDLHVGVGQLEEARAVYVESVEIAERLAEAHPNRLDYQRDLTVSYSKLGKLHDAFGQLEQAHTAYLRSFEIAKRLAAAEPERADYQRDLSVMYNNVGDVLSANGDLAEALKAYRASVEIRELLAKKNANSAGWERDLLVSYNNLGGLYRSLGDFENALAAYMHSRAVSERLTSQQPSNVTWQRDLSVVNSNLGDLYFSLGQLDDARVAHGEALEISERLASQQPSNFAWQRDLSISCSKVGDVLRVLSQWESARAAYLRSFAIAERLALQQPTNSALQRDLSVSCSKVGDLYRSLEQWESARVAYLQALAIAQHVVSQDACNVGWQRDISALQRKIGDILLEEGNLSDASVFYRLCEGTRKRIAGQAKIRAHSQTKATIGVGVELLEPNPARSLSSPGARREFRDRGAFSGRTNDKSLNQDSSQDSQVRCTDQRAQRDICSPIAADLTCWKRTLDITCILLGLPIWLPAVIFLALWVKLASPGPILFRQERVGYRGKRFMMLKFRTMKVNVETQSHERYLEQLINGNRPMTKLDASGDPRIIPGGRILRAMGLDELPQLLNVLLGEMSLVGPRPCTPHEFARYQVWQRKRFNALPGLTGYWQVNGKNKTTFTEMINLDVFYTKNLSLWLDLSIIAKTPFAVIAQFIELHDV